MNFDVSNGKVNINTIGIYNFLSTKLKRVTVKMNVVATKVENSNK